MSYRAQCACKEVSITVSNDPVRCFACHCDYCQRTTGSVGITAAVFREHDIVAIEGKFQVFTLPQSPGTERHFCANCGCGLHWVNPNAFPEMRIVSLGCFDDPSAWDLSRTFQNQYRPVWCPQFQALESYEVYPD